MARLEESGSDYIEHIYIKWAALIAEKVLKLTKRYWNKRKKPTSIYLVCAASGTELDIFQILVSLEQRNLCRLFTNNSKIYSNPKEKKFQNP